MRRIGWGGFRKVLDNSKFSHSINLILNIYVIPIKIVWETHTKKIAKTII